MLQKRLVLLGLGMILLLACSMSQPAVLTGEDPEVVSLRQTMSAMQAYGTLAPPTPVELPVNNPPETQSAAPTTAVNETQPTLWPTGQPVAGYYDYAARSGDTLAGLAGRFGVEAQEISAGQALPQTGYLPIGVGVRVPDVLENVTPGSPLLPDSELIYSPAAANFDVAAFIQQAGGYLGAHREVVEEQTVSGAEIIQRVADELSVSPRLLLAFLEYRSGWVYGQPRSPQDLSQPIGFNIPDRKGLYQETMIVATQLNVAYYGWRAGTFTTLTFSDGNKQRLNPTLNPGSVAVQHLLAMFNWQPTWWNSLDGEGGFLATYRRMFGDPWALAVEPLLPDGLAQPVLELPFPAGEAWALTSGPHNAFNSGTPRGALDFSPITGQPKCQVSRAWVTALAPGVIVRSSYNSVVIDLDGDGREQTGWVVFYYHVADQERIAAGVRVNLDDRLGHPSCEGGRATGTHIHLARKYNGEWVEADGPLPFALSGWRAVAGKLNYQGSLVRGSEVVNASPGGERGSTIVR
jgi:murein DD-endopeptidase MepM/ murein hydrolase activator NlpD